MNRDGGGRPSPRPARAGRQITEEEAALWHEVSRSVDKVKTKPRVTAHAMERGDTARGEAAAPPGATPPPPRRRSERPPPAPAALPQARPPGGPPIPAEIDRRTHRQVAAGKLPIDAVLDLHGLTQQAAHRRLRAFLVDCQAKGHKLVLVVTGKGAPPSDARGHDWPAEGSPRGVLRRSVPLWLEEPELRAIVLSYAAAGMRHGGEGALYIRLRKARPA